MIYMLLEAGQKGYTLPSSLTGRVLSGQYAYSFLPLYISGRDFLQLQDSLESSFLSLRSVDKSLPLHIKSIGQVPPLELPLAKYLHHISASTGLQCPMGLLFFIGLVPEKGQVTHVVPLFQVRCQK